MPPKPAKSRSKRVVKRPEGTSQLNVNIPLDLFEKLDAWVEKLNASPAGPRWNRTDIVRTVLSKAIETHADKGEAP